jgi:hypothetical protein
MRIITIILTIFLMNLATVLWPATSIRCNPILKSSWSFDPSNNISEYEENKEGLSSFTFLLDSGFIKISDAQNTNTQLFQQNAIIEKTRDSNDITARYESTFNMELEKTSIIISNPMCQNTDYSIVNIFETVEFGYTNTAFNCDCLSSIHATKHFIRN